jgi:hypothetical protein
MDSGRYCDKWEWFIEEQNSEMSCGTDEEEEEEEEDADDDECLLNHLLCFIERGNIVKCNTIIKKYLYKNLITHLLLNLLPK